MAGVLFIAHTISAVRYLSHFPLSTRGWHYTNGIALARHTLCRGAAVRLVLCVLGQGL